MKNASSKTKLWLIAGLFLIPMACAQVVVPRSSAPAIPQPIRWKQWHSFDGDVAIGHPPDWREADHPPALLLLIAPSPASEDFVDSLTLTRQHMPKPPVSLDDYVRMGEPALAAAPNFTMVSDDLTLVSAIPARRLVYSAYGNATPRGFEQIILIANDDIYVLTLTCGSMQKLRASEPLLNEMLLSLQFRQSLSTLPKEQNAEAVH